MKVLLIDTDSKIPNLALMKLSTYYKNMDYDVELLKLNLPYYPNRKKEIKIIDTKEYEKVHCSIVFDVNKNFVQGDNIDFGGSGYSLDKKLPEEIENLSPDYELYGEKETSYGFITRGCIRNCSFCIVPKKEGKIQKVAEISDIVKHKQTKFFDNNILAYDKHIEVLQELVDKKIRCCFNQGLDARLVNEDNAKLINKMNYLDKKTFAFDDLFCEKDCLNTINLIQKRDWQIRFFTYYHPKMGIENLLYRINFCKKNKVYPYMMRDIQCYNDKDNLLWTSLSQWVNQHHLFRYIDFDEFMMIRHEKRNLPIDRVNYESNVYRTIMKGIS